MKSYSRDSGLINERDNIRGISRGEMKVDYTKLLNWNSLRYYALFDYVK